MDVISSPNKTWKKKAISFFQEARQSRQEHSQKNPCCCCCKMSKGLLIAILVIITFSLIILWVVLINENFDVDNIALAKYKTKRSNLSVNGTNSFYSGDKKAFWKNHLYIMFIAVIFVICIIVFIFAMSVFEYLCEKANHTTETENALTFIFESQHKRDSLFYLRQNELQQQTNNAH